LNLMTQLQSGFGLCLMPWMDLKLTRLDRFITPMTRLESVLDRVGYGSSVDMAR
jgi:hypothetical protein